MKKLLIAMVAMLSLVGCKTVEPQANAENTAAPAEAANADKAKPTNEAKPADNNANDDVTAKLLDPSALNETAPVEFIVKVKTTKGEMRIKLDRSLAPKGVDRFYNLVKNGYFTDIGLFRMVKGFVIQFGIHGKPLLNNVWREANIQDDIVSGENTRGTLTFATSGPNSRTTQLFINLGDNTNLDLMGFAPIGKVIDGIELLDKLNFEYGERPNQMLIQTQGNAYLREKFPNLDYIISMEIEG